ncbi:MFS transporter [Pectinatus frisingensis]|uniref:MFS transporter n=1 Tax=Pectinatus frisingensis TaxID=865 RepID=UPI0015F58516|nr:MFS transporter [Pectinatus frisingensis]
MQTSITKTVKNHKTYFRWIVLGIIFVTYSVNFADRSNVGVVIPFLKQEFPINNFEAGAIMSFFFLGYAISQIPAGLFFSKFGVRGLTTLSIMGFSIITFLLGTIQSITSMKWLRFALGITEGPTPVGMTTTINRYFPAQEKATATGMGYIGATMFAPIVVPPIAVWIAVNFGWRYVFYIFAIPGILMAFIWHRYVKNKPEQSPYCNKEELAYIQETAENGTNKSNYKSLGWIDKFIRAKPVKLIKTNKNVFLSWNIVGNTIAYFFMVCVLQGLLTWIPSYLVTAKGYSFLKMGFVASAPWVGGFIGSVIGGWLSDKVFNSRRKPTMLITALATCFMMVILINVPENVTLVAITLFMVGFMLNIGWPAFSAYPMGLTTKSTYPTAISLVNSGGNLGGFFSPMIAGALLDIFKNYNIVFSYFAVSAIIGFIIILTLAEPVNETK